MDDDPLQPEEPKPKGRGGMLWLLAGLAPIPIGLLIGPAKIFNSLANQDQKLAWFYAGIVFICSVACGIGQSGGFKSKTGGDIFRGVVAGVFIGVVNFVVVFFAGCCSAIKGI